MDLIVVAALVARNGPLSLFRRRFYGCVLDVQHYLHGMSKLVVIDAGEVSPDSQMEYTRLWVPVT